MKIFTILAWIFLTGISFYVLLIGKDLLVPLLVAIIIWYLINTLTYGFERLSLQGKTMVRPLCFALSMITISLILTMLIRLITINISDVIYEAPRYQQNLQKVIGKFFTYINVKEPPSLSQVLNDFDFSNTLSRFALAITGLAGNTGIISIYVLFLFLEQKSFRSKFSSLFTNESKRTELIQIINHINSDIRVYLGIKTLTSIITGVASFMIMAAVDLDFASFWAILIFLFNFIPTIGSIIATIFPTILALVQFESIIPFIIVGGGVTGLQFLIGNVLEPRLMGNRLNLSPLIILLSLALWGNLWGITGMILSVPITAIMLIVFAHFPQTRPLAVVLSKKGQIESP